MTERRAVRSAPRHRLPWALFAGASVVGLAVCAVASAGTGSGTNVVLALLGGLMVVGLGAALLAAALGPEPEGGPQGLSRPRGSGGWVDGGSLAGGDFSGGGGGGGD